MHETAKSPKRVNDISASQAIRLKCRVECLNEPINGTTPLAIRTWWGGNRTDVGPRVLFCVSPVRVKDRPNGVSPRLSNRRTCGFGVERFQAMYRQEASHLVETANMGVQRWSLDLKSLRQALH
jgi:hypothetical protein